MQRAGRDDITALLSVADMEVSASGMAEHST